MRDFSSPGRIEILGNHTDHNHGEVLVGAIELSSKAKAKKTDDGIVYIKSDGYRDVSIDINDTSKKDNEEGSKAVVRGVIEGFKRNNLKVGGLYAEVSSNIPKGAGVSSSASFELLVAQMLNVFYNDSKIDRVLLAKIAQYAENEYMNKPCGLLDQMGISLGGIVNIDFKDINNPKIRNMKLDLCDYKIMVTSTGGDHTGLTNAYAGIKDEMKAVAKVFNKEYLADVSYVLFSSSLEELQKKVSGRAILRAAHFYEENERVRDAVKCLERNDIEVLFKCIKESGESSYKLLQNCYVNNDVEQRIPLALYISSKLLTKGAYRVHGGGFKGTILAIVHNSEYDKYYNEMKKVFGESNIYITNFRMDGAI